MSLLKFLFILVDMLTYLRYIFIFIDTEIFIELIYLSLPIPRLAAIVYSFQFVQVPYEKVHFRSILVSQTKFIFKLVLINLMEGIYYIARQGCVRGKSIINDR